MRAQKSCFQSIGNPFANFPSLEGNFIESTQREVFAGCLEGTPLERAQRAFKRESDYPLFRKITQVAANTNHVIAQVNEIAQNSIISPQISAR